MLITGNDRRPWHDLLGPLRSRGRPLRRPPMIIQLLVSFVGLRAMLVGLVSLEPMAAAWLAQTETQSAPANPGHGRR